MLGAAYSYLFYVPALNFFPSTMSSCQRLTQLDDGKAFEFSVDISAYPVAGGCNIMLLFTYLRDTIFLESRIWSQQISHKGPKINIFLLKVSVMTVNLFSREIASI